MTENQSKLKTVVNRYKILKFIAEIAPMISAVLLVIVFSLQLATLPYTLKIYTSVKAQDLTREGILKYRQERIETENRILENQNVINQKLDSLLKK